MLKGNICMVAAEWQGNNTIQGPVKPGVTSAATQLFSVCSLYFCSFQNFVGRDCFSCLSVASCMGGLYYNTHNIIPVPSLFCYLLKYPLWLHADMELNEPQEPLRLLGQPLNFLTNWPWLQYGSTKRIFTVFKDWGDFCNEGLASDSLSSVFTLQTNSWKWQ